MGVADEAGYCKVDYGPCYIFAFSIPQKWKSAYYNWTPDHGLLFIMPRYNLKYISYFYFICSKIRWDKFNIGYTLPRGSELAHLFYLYF